MESITPECELKFKPMKCICLQSLALPVAGFLQDVVKATSRKRSRYYGAVKRHLIGSLIDRKTYRSCRAAKHFGDTSIPKRNATKSRTTEMLHNIELLTEKG